MSNKILIIGKEAIIISALQAKLSADSFEIITHNGISEANEIILFIKLNKPDYIIQAIGIFGKKEFSLLKNIKYDNIVRAIPIFLITNSLASKDKLKFENLGIDYFFNKNDYGMDALVEKIKKIIENHPKKSI